MTAPSKYPKMLFSKDYAELHTGELAHSHDHEHAKAKHAETVTVQTPEDEQAQHAKGYREKADPALWADEKEKEAAPVRASRRVATE